MRTGASIALCVGLFLCSAALISAQGFPGPGGGGPFGGGNGGNNGGNSNGGNYNSGSSSSSSSNSGSSSNGQQQCNTGCCNLGNQVFKGACASFANAFKDNADTAINEDDAAFQARVNRAPIPSDTCCVSARSFTQYGCSCNQSLRDAAAPQGFSSNAVAVIGRAVQHSVCADSNHGGSIGSGGC